MGQRLHANLAVQGKKYTASVFVKTCLLIVSDTCMYAIIIQRCIPTGSVFSGQYMYNIILNYLRMNYRNEKKSQFFQYVNFR